MVFSVSFKNHRKRETGQLQTSVGCMTSCVEFLENANESLMLKASQWLHGLETERGPHMATGDLWRGWESAVAPLHTWLPSVQLSREAYQVVQLNRYHAVHGNGS